jgi:hypothetical protein
MMPDPATRERQHCPLATHHPTLTDCLPTTPQSCIPTPYSGSVMAIPHGRCHDHLWKRHGDQLPGSLPNASPPPLAPHHPDLSRTPLRLRHSPRLRRPHRRHRPSHHHLHQSQPARSRHRSCHDDRSTAPARPTVQTVTDVRSPVRATTLPPDAFGVAHLTKQNTRLLPWGSWNSPGLQEISWECVFSPPSDTSFGDLARVQ